MIKTISLPHPTNATLKGPYVEADNNTLRLKYDFEKMDGSIEWSEILFSEVLAYRFHQSACADAGSNMESTQITEYDTSTWLDSVLDKWDQAVGWQKYQLDRGGRSRFRHYSIHFDDVGVFEAICSKAEVN